MVNYSEGQKQTSKCFEFKWNKRETYESEKMKEFSKKWLFERYCSGDTKKLIDWLKGGRKSILDAGCGSGYSTLLFFGEFLREHDYLGIDISSAVSLAKTRFQEIGLPGNFIQVDLMNLSVPDESFDLIFSEGVLHHTDSVEKSIQFLTRKLKTGGRFLFYVYLKKSVIREFTDDLVRDKLQHLTEEQAWESLKPLTKLGIELGKIKVDIHIPEDIPFLGIKKEKINLQRFFYWNICKLFYSPELNLDELNHINFDWYRPLNCHRHTVHEINNFCSNAGLKIEYMNVQNSGMTVVALKG